jgi:hypothetical protein
MYILDFKKFLSKMFCTVKYSELCLAGISQKSHPLPLPPKKSKGARLYEFKNLYRRKKTHDSDLTADKIFAIIISVTSISGQVARGNSTATFWLQAKTALAMPDCPPETRMLSSYNLMTFSINLYFFQQYDQQTFQKKFFRL